MEMLRELFAGLKFSNVETFIASGNVIFDTKAAPDQKLEQKIEKHLEAALGYEVGTFVRSIEEIRAISVYRAFFERRGEGRACRHVGFLRDVLDPERYRTSNGFRSRRRRFSRARTRGILAVPHRPERFEILRQEI